jgi:hypothetical protein
MLLCCGLYEFLLHLLQIPDGFSVLKVSVTALLLTSGSLLILLYTRMRGRLKNEVSVYVRIVYGALLCWTFIVIARSVSLNTQDLVTLIGSHRITWALLAPLALVLGLRVSLLIDVLAFWISAGSYFIFVGIVLLILSPDRSGFALTPFFLIYPLLLIMCRLVNLQAKVVIIGGILLLMIVSFLASIRINFVFVFASGIVLTLMYLLDVGPSRFRKVLVGMSAAVLVITSLLLTDKIYDAALNSSMGRIDVDTRSFLFIELFDDLSALEEIVGRGALGDYYSPFFMSWHEQGFEGGDSEYRQTVEVGYLKMILKGGGVLVILNLLLAVPAAYKGIRSNNQIVQCCGYFILLFLLLWMISFPIRYSPYCLILWICVGVCLSGSNRRLSDDDIRVIVSKENIAYFEPKRVSYSTSLRSRIRPRISL